MKHLPAALLSAAALLLGGCFTDETVMKVNADGSGTLVVTTQMKTTSIQKMKEMAKAFGGDNAKEPEFFSEKDAKEKAAKLGEGVEFVSCEPVKGKDSEGQKVTYSFKDITKLKLNEMSDPPGGGGAGGFKAQAKKSDPITFKFAKLANGNSLITVVNPSKEPKAAPAPETPAPPGDVPEEQLGMMKEMMGGLKVSIRIDVGKLVKTNSPHASGSSVTLIEMDFDKIIADLPKFKKLVAAPPKSPDEAKALLKDFPGVKVNVEPETTIEYSGK
ncbi:MAG: hypothetical protein HY293_07635 [Planctomycetes bacterium]|nr:hypothetical protein [Planctomycetota bacterium]